MLKSKLSLIEKTFMICGCFPFNPRLEFRNPLQNSGDSLPCSCTASKLY